MNTNVGSCKHNPGVRCWEAGDKCRTCAWCPATDRKIRKKRVRAVMRRREG